MAAEPITGALDGSMLRSPLVADPETGAGGRRVAVGLLAFVPVAVALQGVSLLLRYADVGTAVMFPAYAALTAALVVSRPRDWTWYLLIDAAAHFAVHWPHWSLSWVLLAGLANVARALTAAVLLRRMLGVPPRIDGIGALTRFLAIAAVAAPVVGATIGAANVVLHGASPSYWAAWRAWFTSNALTGLTMLPASICVASVVVGMKACRFNSGRVVEGTLLALATVTTCACVFLDGFDRWNVAMPVYASLPVLVWSALRFGVSRASATLTLLTLTAIWSVDRGTGPFRALGLDENIISLQLFVLFASVPILCLAAVAAARQGAAQLHAAVLASLEDHLAVLDARGIVVEVNESWRRFAEWADLPAYHRVRAGDDFTLMCRDAIAMGDETASLVLAGVTRVLAREQRRFEIAYDHVSAGGRESYVVSVQPLARADGGAVVTRSDVTARRQAQIELQAQRRQLSHLARVAVLGQLSGAIAHELHQPLTAILSNAEAALRMMQRAPADMQFIDDVLHDIVADDRRASAVIDRLRALLKQGARRLQPIDARTLVGEVLELAHTELITRHVATTAVVDPALGPFAGDRVQLQQVLLNLVLNACEAMHDTPVAERKIVVMADDDGAGGVHLAVQDTGPGIAPDVIERLFEPFVTTKSDGLGLGLSISRTILSAHGGRMWAENAAEGGATIHCVLPFVHATWPSLPTAPTTPVAALQDG